MDSSGVRSYRYRARLTAGGGEEFVAFGPGAATPPVCGDRAKTDEHHGTNQEQRPGWTNLGSDKVVVYPTSSCKRISGDGALHLV